MTWHDYVHPVNHMGLISRSGPASAGSGPAPRPRALPSSIYDHVNPVNFASLVNRGESLDHTMEPDAPVPARLPTPSAAIAPPDVPLGATASRAHGCGTAQGQAARKGPIARV